MNLSLFLVLFLFQAAVPADTAQDHRAAVQQELKQFDESMIPELLKLAQADSDPTVRLAILTRVSRVNSPVVREALRRHAATDPDARVSLLALEKLRIQEAQDLGRIFDKRLALARSLHDDKALTALTEQHQRWASIARGSTLPGFLQVPPPVFEAIRPQKTIRVLAIGDIGEPTPEQRKVAAAAVAYHREKRFDFGLTLGDNFAPDGVTSPGDNRWNVEWEALYGPAGIPIFASTGNHDWGFGDSPAAEILYSGMSRSWRMPALYYSFVAGPVQFFALATNAWSETQARWLDQELARSKARWKVVYGHHPVYSYGTHGPLPVLQESLLPILRNRAQVYLFGHEHIVQVLGPEAGVHFLDAPVGGQSVRPAKSGPLTVHSDSFYGFVVLEFSKERAKVEFVDTDRKVRYRMEIN